MPDFGALFVAYFFVALAAILAAIGINKAIFGVGRLIADWWTMRRVRRQAKAER